MIARQIQRLFLSIPLMLMVIGLDQATKVWARVALKDQRPLELLQNYLLFQYHENPGIAFSMAQHLPGGRFILTGVGLTILVLVWRVVSQVKSRTRLADVALGLIAGGAIGNIVDRIYLGRVVDFIVMHWQYRYSWPAYNVADASLCVGVGLLIIALGTQSQAAAYSRGSQKRSTKRRK